MREDRKEAMMIKDADNSADAKVTIDTVPEWALTPAGMLQMVSSSSREPLLVIRDNEQL